MKLVNPANKRKYNVLIVGTGLAGGSAAATLGELGYNIMAFCYQDSPRRAHSIAAQGGINAAKNYQNDGLYRDIRVASIHSLRAAQSCTVFHSCGISTLANWIGLDDLAFLEVDFTTEGFQGDQGSRLIDRAYEGTPRPLGQRGVDLGGQVNVVL